MKLLDRLKRIYQRHRRVIYHILPREDWQTAQREGIYAPVSLGTGGFIHCSKVDQVTHVANSYFEGRDDLLLLGISSDKVNVEIRYEDLLGEGMLFPHIYGPLNLDAVVNVSKLKKDERGKFGLPKSISNQDG
jgi:uncharacterized protein (DUF952 family)